MDLDWMKGAGTLVAGIGTVYGAVKQAESMKDYNKIANEKFQLDKKELNRQIGKEDAAQLNLDSAVSEVYRPKKKKKLGEVL